jgi:hypothetical protein
VAQKDLRKIKSPLDNWFEYYENKKLLEKLLIKYNGIMIFGGIN